jgi:hypothetical protein
VFKYDPRVFAIQLFVYSQVQKKSYFTCSIARTQDYMRLCGRVQVIIRDKTRYTRMNGHLKWSDCDSYVH